MPKGYRTYLSEQELLLPRSLREWLPEDHLVYFVSDVVDQLDLSAIHAVYEKEKRGQPDRRRIAEGLLTCERRPSGAAAIRRVVGWNALRCGRARPETMRTGPLSPVRRMPRSFAIPPWSGRRDHCLRKSSCSGRPRYRATIAPYLLEDKSDRYYLDDCLRQYAHTRKGLDELAAGSPGRWRGRRRQLSLLRCLGFTAL